MAKHIKLSLSIYLMFCLVCQETLTCPWNVHILYKLCQYSILFFNGIYTILISWCTTWGHNLEYFSNVLCLLKSEKIITTKFFIFAFLIFVCSAYFKKICIFANTFRKSRIYRARDRLKCMKTKKSIEKVSYWIWNDAFRKTPITTHSKRCF